MFNFVHILILYITVTFSTLSAHAHELWLDSKQFKLSEGKKVEIEQHEICEPDLVRKVKDWVNKVVEL